MELRHLKKYYDYITEKLAFSLTFRGILDYLASKKHNKIASLLLNTSNRQSSYNTDEEINWISSTDDNNMISYLPKNRAAEFDIEDDWEEFFRSPRRTSIRIGRAIRKILDVIKTKLSMNIESNSRVFLFKTEDQNGDQVSNFVIDLPEDEVNIDELKKTILLYSTTETDNYYQKACDIENTKADVIISLSNGTISFTADIREIDQDFYKFGMMDLCNFKDIKYDGQDKDRFFLDIEKFVKVINYPYSHSAIIIDPETKKKKEVTRNSLPFDVKTKITIRNNIETSDSEVEKFVNEYISLIKMSRSDSDSKMIEVSGEDIRKWYLNTNYQSTIGKLGNSCMSYDSCQHYLDIYTQNPDKISMLILVSGENKLIGRALLWKLDDNRIFMDRIYSSFDSDDNIFYNYAIEHGYLYRNTPNQNTIYFKDGKEIPKPSLKVTLKKCIFEYYPYMDTFRYLNTSNKLLHTKKSLFGSDRELRDTEGRYTEYYDETEPEN